MIGRQLGRYRIVEKLGAGGMGEVYRAHDDQLDRQVAIKLLPPSSFEDSHARARLLREARAAAGLNHPSICTVHEVGAVDGQAYIAMEFIEGVPLSDVARRALPLPDVLRYGCQIADALAHAHARQIVHRDLKCANVIVTADGRIKVLDFGLAKKVSEHVVTDATTRPQARATLTEPGALAGTPAYMAPEQLRGEPADARSDVWALGIVLYEIATGARPFKANSIFELSSKILDHPPSPLPRNVPVAARAVIEKCLEKEPSRRYQTANEVRAALEAIQATGTTSWLTLQYALTRRRWLAPGVALAVLAGVVAGLSLDMRWFGGVPRVESLAVLPLENLTGDAAQDYFADGMTEVLSTDLARLSGLKRVTARSSVMRYKGTSRPLAEIARELRVDALVTGSVSRSADRVGITAQLLDPATGDQLWSNRYERDIKDVLVLRNEIVSAIVREIRAQVTPSEQARLASARAVNPEAFQAYLRGRFEWYKQTRDGFDLAEKYFHFALQQDRDYALGYAGLASVWFMRGDVGLQPPRETFPKASAFMSRALELGDEMPETHVLLGNYKAVTEWDWAGAERAYTRAIALNPNFADARFFYADLLLVLRRPDEWEGEMQRAMELDPLNEFHRSYYGWHLNYLHRYDEAIPIFQQLLPTGPNKAANYLGLWGAFHRSGQYDQAIASAREYFIATGDREFADALGTAHEAAGYRAAMKRVGNAMAVRSAERHVPGIRVARMFAHAGDNDTALQWLEKAYDDRESALMRLGVFWDWLDLHADPRFQALLRRLNLS